MRVMVVRPGPRFSVMDVHRGLCKGLAQNGCEVIDFRFDDLVEFYGSIALKNGRRWKTVFNQTGVMHVAAEHIYKELYLKWPDVVVFTSGFWLHPEVMGVLRMRPHKVVLWCTESPYEDDKQMPFAEWADVVVINDPINLSQYRKANPNTHYIPQSYDPDVHCPGPGRPEWACDVGFAGTGFPSRIDFLEKVDWSGIDFRLGGMWEGAGDELASHLVHPKDECIDNVDAVDLYRSAKASFNLYRREANSSDLSVGWAMGPREVELAASGTFFLRDPRREGDDLFPMLPTFQSPEEFGDKLRWWLRHDDARQEAAAAARAAVVDRTFERATARLLSLIESSPHQVAA